MCQPGNYSTMGRQHVTYMLRIYGGEGGAEGTRIVMKGKTTEKHVPALHLSRHWRTACHVWARGSALRIFRPNISNTTGKVRSVQKVGRKKSAMN